MPTGTSARAVFSPGAGASALYGILEIATGGWPGVVFVAGFKVRETMRQKRSPPEARTGTRGEDEGFGAK